MSHIWVNPAVFLTKIGSWKIDQIGKLQNWKIGQIGKLTKLKKIIPIRLN